MKIKLPTARGAAFLIPLIILIVLFAIGTLQIVSRFLFALPFTWGEEAMRLSFVFLVFFGAVAVTCNREHLVVDVLHMVAETKIPPRVWSAYQRGILILQAVFFGLCATGCFQMAGARWNIVSQTMAFWKIGYMYAAAGAALAGCAVVSLFHVFVKSPKE